jgi:tetratricopeptide (TPR) repeat protein
MLSKAKGLSALACAIAALGLAPQVAAQDLSNFQLTRDVREAAQLAQTAIGEGNFPVASATLNQAAAQIRTDSDRFVVARLQLDIANRTFNTAAQVAAINALLASPLLPADQVADLYYHRARISYHLQNVEAARADLQAAIDRGTSNPRIFIAMSSLLSDRSDNAGALAMFERALAIHQTAGIATPADWYRRAIHFAQQTGQQTRVLQLGQMMVAAYPTRRNWRDVAIQHRAAYTADPGSIMDLWRLQAAAGAMTGEFDYRDYARAAHAAGLPSEIERIVQAGRAANVLDGGNSEIATLDRGTTRAADALRAALPRRAQAAGSAATGENAIAAANDYLSLGDYAAAAPLYRTAIEKGSVDAELANLRLGIVLAMSSDAEGARTALDLVTGPRALVARLWRAYVDTRPPPAPPAAAPAG